MKKYSGDTGLINFQQYKNTLIINYIHKEYEKVYMKGVFINPACKMGFHNLLTFMPGNKLNKKVIIPVKFSQFKTN